MNPCACATIFFKRVSTLKVFVEGYGCSANRAETEQIKGFFQSQNAELVSKPEQADWLIVHSCGVKKSTEFKLKRRVQKLGQLNQKAKIVVSGCLPKINPHLLENEKRVIQAGTSLNQIVQLTGFSSQDFSPTLSELRFNPLVSMIPIARGCLSNCSFCGTKKAKGTLQSHPIEAIQTRFQRDLKKGTKEFWLTSQDNGCYGFDLKTNLPALVQALLSNEGNFRIRIGMLSPQYLPRYLDEFVSLFSDERLYRFVHLPVQGGNNRILKEMRRQYLVEEFESLVSELRHKVPDFSLSIDLIAGFPTETKSEFLDSVRLVERTRPDIVNISRYGLRPGTVAAQMPQLVDREKSRRSHILHRVCRNIFLEKNRSLVGRKETVLVSEKAKLNGFVARTNSYKPVVVPKAELNEFALARITEAFPTFLKGHLEFG